MVVQTTQNGKKVYAIRYEKTGRLGNKRYPTREAAQRVIDNMRKYKHMKESQYAVGI